jgi:hypothetical protein
MTRKPVDAKTWADITRQLYNQGIAVFRTKNLSEEEENREMRDNFEQVWKIYPHIHTLLIEPLNSTRQPYYVHVDDINRK